MSVARSTCLRCCLEVAERQAVDPNLELCGRCQQPILARSIIVDNSGITALRSAIFNRLRSPRPLRQAANTVSNISYEQMATWMTRTWTHVRTHQTAKADVVIFCLVEWSDIHQLCSFQEVSAGTRHPTQGRGNVRFAQNTLGVICPPILVIHRCTPLPRPYMHPSLPFCIHRHSQDLGMCCRTKRFVDAARRNAVPDPNCMVRIERVQVKYSIGIVHEYSNSIQLSLDYPVEVPEAPDIKTWPALPPYHTPFTYIREKFRRDMVALDVHAFRGEEGQQLLENVRMWNAENI